MRSYIRREIEEMRNKRNLVTALAIALALCAVPVGHGVMSAFAAESGNDVVTAEDEVIKALDDVLDNKDSVTIDSIETVVSQVGGVEKLRAAMDSTPKLVGKISELEEAVKKNSNIKTEAPAVTTEAGQYVNFAMVFGAALNANQPGDTVQLSVDVKETPAEFDPAAYGVSKAITLDLKLNITAADGQKSEVHSLKSPLFFNMPSPVGLSGGIVIYHQLSDGSFETIYPQYSEGGSAGSILAFTVDSFSKFIFAEVPVENSEEIAEVEEEPSGREKVSDLIESAADNATIVITKDMGVNYLSNSQMKALVKRGNVTLKMEYIYQGKEYSIVIPAGGAENNDIEWYGPLYLAAHYSGNAVPAVAASGDTYQVQKGDTLSKIAAKYGTTVNNLKALNPQIKNVDMIYTGWKLNVK